MIRYGEGLILRLNYDYQPFLKPNTQNLTPVFTQMKYRQAIHLNHLIDTERNVLIVRLPSECL